VLQEAKRGSVTVESSRLNPGEPAGFKWRRFAHEVFSVLSGGTIDAPFRILRFRNYGSNAA